MTKIFIGISAVLVVFIVFGFFHYSSVVAENGRLDQSNRQFKQTIDDLNKQLNIQQRNRQAESVIGQKHFDEAMAIKDEEYKSLLAIKEYKVEQITKQLTSLKNANTYLMMIAASKKEAESKQVKAGLDKAEKEHSNESLSEQCIEVPVPEFYLKQL